MKEYKLAKQNLERKICEVYGEEFEISTEAALVALKFAKTKFEYEELYGYTLELEEVLKIYSKMK